MVEPAVVVCVAEETVGMSELSAEAHCKLRIQFVVVGGIGTHGVAGAVGYAGSHAGGGHGRQCPYVYLSAHGVAAVEHSLSSAQNLYRFDVGEVEVVGVFVQHRHIVDGESHHRLVHPCTYATHIYARGHSGAIGRHMEVRCDFPELVCAFHLQSFCLCAGYACNGLGLLGACAVLYAEHLNGAQHIGRSNAVGAFRCIQCGSRSQSHRHGQ